MKRILISLSLIVCQMTMTHMLAQTLRVKMNDGTTVSLPIGSIRDIQFRQMEPPSMEGLTGQWKLIASNNGVQGEGGIYTPGTDTIRFTATLAPDGNSLLCHTDKLYWRSGRNYPADWSIVVEQDGDKRRIGWVLNSENPVSETEFQEPAANYLENGNWYWGDKFKGGEDNGHRYIYLLSENIDHQRIEGMTLWSGWLNKSGRTFAFPQNQQIYGIVAMQVPFAQTIGYFEIWASTRFEKE